MDTKTKKFFSKRTIFLVLVIWQIFIVILVTLAFKLGMTTKDAEENIQDIQYGKALIPEVPKNTTLLIAISTIPSKFERRETLRGTWAKHTSLYLTDNTTSAAKPHDIMISYFFTVGFAGNPSIDNDTERESGIHKDILRVNLNESYRGIVTKICLPLNG